MLVNNVDFMRHIDTIACMTLENTPILTKSSLAGRNPIRVSMLQAATVEALDGDNVRKTQRESGHETVIGGR